MSDGDHEETETNVAVDNTAQFKAGKLQEHNRHLRLLVHKGYPKEHSHINIKETRIQCGKEAGLFLLGLHLTVSCIFH